MNWAQKQAGFTIVELLIVVVVIAILAAITIVSYNGIQQQARNSAISSKVDAWDKIIRMAAVNEVTLPPVGACLGGTGDFTAKDGFVANACVMVDGVAASTITFNESNYATWGPLGVKRPTGELAPVEYATGGSQIRSRGIWVGSVNPATRSIELRWLAQIDGKCSRGTAFSAPITGSYSGGYCSLNIAY